MNIILTRPLIDTENLMTELLKLGHNIIHIPTLKITSLNMKPIDLSQFKALIFTSANSVRNLNILSSKSDILCFCVGSITEKIARGKGFINTISAEGTVHALKNLISNSEYLEKDSKLAYVCGDQITLDLEKELVAEGFRVKKIINYSSSKIDIINEKNIELIKKFPPDIIFVYSMRSAESFISIINNFSLAPMMTQSHVMCISKKINDYF